MKKLAIGLVILVLVGLGIGVYLYNKPHRDFASEEAAYTLTADELAYYFNNDLESAKDKFLDKVVIVEGEVADKQEAGFIMEPGVYISLQDTAVFHRLQEGDEIGIKGRVLGYDDLMEEVKIDNASAIGYDQ
jgi:hypothetical protein